MSTVISRIEDGIAVLSIANPPVNALSAAVRSALDAALVQAADDEAVSGIVITAEGNSFIAGADISEFGKSPSPPSLPDVLTRIDGLPKPVVAAINGTALGGGLELALACHERVALPQAKLGLPEIKLGLIPGAGGTQRLPRLIGPAKAFSMMLEGSTLGAREALAVGLIDEIAGDDLIAVAKARAKSLAALAKLPSVRLRDDRLNQDERDAFEAAAAKAERSSQGMPNVGALIEAVRAVFTGSFTDNLRLEREHFKLLVVDEKSKALRHAFFAERAATKLHGPKVTERPIAQVAVIGAGTMGAGIAISFANAGIRVTLIETSEEALARGMDRVIKTFDGDVKRSKLSEDEAHIRKKAVEGRVGLEAAADADLIVEAAFEDMSVKKEIFSALDRIAKPGAILATNTSYLDVNEIAGSTSRPQDVLGLHFFSPANIMRLLEIVRAGKTSPEVLATAVSLGRKIGKIPVVVGVCHGFVGNRMLARRTKAAERLLIEGALPYQIDVAAVDFGFRMGPFATSDLAGLDIGWRNRKALGEKAPIADALCGAGRFGQKTGKGYYLYEDGSRSPKRDPEVETLIETVSKNLGVTRREIDAAEIVERLIYPMINEGARILEEQIAARPGDIDVIWINGYGWPSWRGGPMYYADTVGLGHISESLQSFADKAGDETLQPAKLLTDLAAAGTTFSAHAEHLAAVK